MSHHTLPINLTFSSQDRALVVGGGHIALQKVTWLCTFGMTVEVLSLSLCAPLTDLVNSGQIKWIKQSYSGLTKSYRLIVAATNDDRTNAQVAKDARAAHIPVNVVDTPALCDFFVPAVIKRGAIQVTIGSGGASPTLVRRLKHLISGVLPPYLTVWSNWLDQNRTRVQRREPDANKRQSILAALAGWSLQDRLARAPQEEWTSILSQMADHPETMSGPTGTVYLVGAGPGAPGLLTIRGLEILANADAVLYDGLVNKEIIALANPHAQLFDTSKRAGCALNKQEEINERLVTLARAGKTVCRLKGGDPMVFGRGGEEAAHLADAQIPFEVVPGISSAVAAPAYAGIPITHRRHASYFQVITGHEAEEKTLSRVNWQDVAKSQGTLVFLMGARRLKPIADRLIRHGMDKRTPVAIISRGTLPTQQVWTTTLAEAANEKETQLPNVPRPALFVVGRVVHYRNTLQWFK